jgi:hypothetical protein
VVGLLTQLAPAIAPPHRWKNCSSQDRRRSLYAPRHSDNDDSTGPFRLPRRQGGSYNRVLLRAGLLREPALPTLLGRGVKLAGTSGYWVGHSSGSFAVGLMSDREPGLALGSRGYSPRRAVSPAADRPPLPGSRSASRGTTRRFCYWCLVFRVWCFVFSSVGSALPNTKHETPNTAMHCLVVKHIPRSTFPTQLDGAAAL